LPNGNVVEENAKKESKRKERARNELMK